MQTTSNSIMTLCKHRLTRATSQGNFLSIFLLFLSYFEAFSWPFLQNNPRKMVTIKNSHSHIRIDIIYSSVQTAFSRTNSEGVGKSLDPTPPPNWQCPFERSFFKGLPYLRCLVQKVLMKNVFIVYCVYQNVFGGWAKIYLWGIRGSI